MKRKLVEDWKMGLLVTSNLPCFWLQKWVWLWDLWCFITWTFVFHNSPQLIPRMEGDSGCGDKRRTEGSGEGNRGGTLVWWKDQIQKTKQNKTKTSTPSSAPRALHPNHLFFSPYAPLGTVKPPLTGSGSSVPASSGHCWGSSFDGLLTSHQPSGCHCEERQKQTSGHGHGQSSIYLSVL